MHRGKPIDQGDRSMISISHGLVTGTDSAWVYPESVPATTFVFRVRHYCILQSLDFFSREAGISGNQFGGKSVALHPLSGLNHILVNGSFLHYNDILFPTERFLTLLCRARLCLFINPINTLYARHLIKVLGIVRDNS